MVFSSMVFMCVFLPAVFVLHCILPGIRAKNALLLLASVIFYAYGDPVYIILLFISTLLNYFCACGIDRFQNHRKGILVLAVICNLGILIVFKYTDFILGMVNSVTGLQLPLPQIRMPIGISFFTFQAMSYVIDVYRGQTAADHHFGRLALFLSLFTNITEGPISRYDQLAGQAFEGHRADYRQFTFGAQLILWGLFQKMVLADRAALLVSTVFGSPSDYSGGIVILAMFVYTLQIYADFAGCMDIVRGSGALFGIEIARNFNQPFFSKSIGEFWRRWHMTLGAWFKDYIFYPVTLSKTNMKLGRWAKKHLSVHLGQAMPTAFALFFVWLANGLWHGAAWKYVAYGMYYYVLTLFGLFGKPVIHCFYEKTGIRKESRPWQLLLIIRTFILVNVGMLLFRANSLRIFAEMFESMFRKTTGNWLELGLDRHDLAVLALGALLMLMVGIVRERGICIRERIASWPMVLRWTVYAGVFCAIVLLGAYGSGYGVVDPLYANF